jgi:hypothetical protein
MSTKVDQALVNIILQHKRSIHPSNQQLVVAVPAAAAATPTAESSSRTGFLCAAAVVQRP